MSVQTSTTVGLILSGGAGSRVEGRDKGLQLYRGRPLIQPVIDVLQPQTEDLIICANRNLRQYLTLGHRVVSDPQPDYQGPLAGIVAAIELLNEADHVDALLVCPCDTPELPVDLRARLQAALTNANAVTVAHDGKQTQYLHCLIARAAWPSLTEFYGSGGRAMRLWQQQISAVSVDFSDQRSAFNNINHTEQLQS